MSSRISAVAAVILTAAVLIGAPATTAGAANAVQTVNAYAGASDGNVDANGFYPGIITISEGDTIRWEVDGFHTVSFGSVAPFDTAAQGDGTYTGGSDIESSGAPVPGGTYSLIFGTGTATNNYSYFCTIHPGMQGLVKVLPTGDQTTPTQGTLDAQAASEKSSDLTAGENSLNSFRTTTTSLPNAATQYNLAAGVAPTQVVNVEIGAPGFNSEGQATVTVAGTNMHIVLSATQLPPGPHPVHVHTGQCAAPVPAVGNNIIFPLPTLTPDGAGNASFTTDVDLSGQPSNVIPEHGWYINIHDAPSAGQAICGDLNPHRSSALRFVANPVSVAVGDSVSWTNLDPQEPHTVTIGANPPGGPFSAPYGGNLVSSPPASTSIHSGVFNEGQSFRLTFNQPGTYSYFCAIHKNAGMVGTVVVSPVSGYWLGAQDGGVFTFGKASFFGSKGSQQLSSPMVAIAPAPDQHGYWLVDSGGRVSGFGSAGNFGGVNRPLTSPVVGIAPTPDGKGYWLTASDGGVFSFGSAKFFGSEGGHPINKPVVGIAAAPDGLGYWLAASDGGVFTHGSAKFFGSEGGHPINKPVVGIAGAPDGLGYWLVASDGGIFTHGSAKFAGSMGGSPLNQPIVAMARTSSGSGYWLVATDGGVFNFGDAPFLGSMGGTTLTKPVIGLAAAA